MEQAYKKGLEIILNMCKKERYIDKEHVILICETVLGKDTDESGDENVCA